MIVIIALISTVPGDMEARKSEQRRQRLALFNSFLFIVKPSMNANVISAGEREGERERETETERELRTIFLLSRVME